LLEAHELSRWPEAIPHSRPRGAKALGKRFEGAVAKQLPTYRRGVWWSFRDANGPGLCQTDLLLVESWATILECKHTWTPEGLDQLRYLYMPVVSRATGKHTIGIQICKNLALNGIGSAVFTDLDEAINFARLNSVVVTVHWRGYTPLSTEPKTKTLTKTKLRIMQESLHG